MIKKTIFIFATLTFLVACKTGQVKVKFENRSDYNFTEFRGQLGDSLIIIKNLKSGEKSKFYTTNHAYAIFSAQTTIDSVTINYRIIDFVGEKKYTNGKVKFKLYVNLNKNDDSKQFQIKAKRIWF